MESFAQICSHLSGSDDSSPGLLKFCQLLSESAREHFSQTFQIRILSV